MVIIFFNNFNHKLGHVSFYTGCICKSKEGLVCFLVATGAHTKTNQGPCFEKPGTIGVKI